MESTSSTIAELKGKRKGKYQSPEKILVDNFTISRQVKLEVDLMIVEKEHYLVSIALPLNHIHCELMPTSPKSSKSILNAINKHISILNAHRFDVTTIKSDDEPGILALREEFSRHGIILENGTRGSKNTCTPTIDQKMSMIKQKARVILSDLKYHLPLRLMKHLFAYIVSRMNCMSSLTALSPFELLTGRKLSYKRDLRIAFGTFVQLDDPDSTNDLKQRRVSAIALHPELDQTGNTWFLPLRDGHTIPIKRSSWIETPITDAVIHFINKMSPKQRLDVAINSLGSGNPENEDITNELFNNSESYLQSINQTSAPPPPAGEQSHNIPNTPVTQQPIQQIFTPPPTILHHNRVEDGGATMRETTPQANEDGINNSTNSSNHPDSPPTVSSSSTPTDNTESEAINEVVEEPQSTVRRSTRSNFGNKYDQNIKKLVSKGYHITVKDFLKINEKKAKEAIIDELKQMKELGVYQPVRPDARLEPNSDLIPAKCINKIKHDSNGTPIKWKSRLVAAGNWQTENTYSDTSSPTIHLSSLYTLLNIALHHNFRIITADIVGAYLQ
jgi:hypothetical protein